MTKHAGAAVLFIAAAIVMTIPLALRLGTHGPALHELRDPLLNIWIINGNLQRLEAGEPLFEANIFHPHPNSLVFSEHLLGLSLLCAPLRAVGMGPVGSYNVLLIVSFVLSGLAAYLLAYHLTGRRDAGVVAGIVYAFAPFKFAQLNHIQMLASFWMPLCLLFGHRYLASRRVGWLALCFVAWILQLLSCWYYFFFLGLAVGIAVVFVLAQGWRPRRRDLLVGVIGTAAVGGIALVLALPYLKERGRDPGFTRTIREADFYAAKLNSYLNTTELNRVWGGLEIGNSPTRTEHQLFPGLAALALGIAGAVGAWRKKDRAVLFYLALALAAGCLSFGPYLHRLGLHIPLPYLLLYHLVPGFKALRTPARLAALVLLGLSVLAARGWASTQKTRRWWPLAAGILLIEYFSAPIPLLPVPGREALPSAYRWLLEEAPRGPVLELPMPTSEEQETIRDAMYVYYSLFHRRQTVNGLSGYVPASHRRIRTLMQSFPDERSCDLLQQLGVRLVLVHPGGPDIPPSPCGWTGRAWQFPEHGDTCRVYEVTGSVEIPSRGRPRGTGE
jgi:hypothetical protein